MLCGFPIDVRVYVGYVPAKELAGIGVGRNTRTASVTNKREIFFIDLSDNPNACEICNTHQFFVCLDNSAGIYVALCDGA